MATFVAGVSLFDPTAYLALYSDVKAAAGSLTGQALSDFAYNHFLLFGASEGRDPLGETPTTKVPNDLTVGSGSAFAGDVGGKGTATGGVFDAAFYLSNNSDVNAAAIAAANAQAASGKPVASNFFAAFALDHFVQFGAAEGRAASASFDQAAYKSANTDVAAAIALHQTTAIQHYLQFGEAEGRAAPAVAGALPPGQGTPGSTFTFTTGVDNLVGTTGNDTFIGDNTGATAQVTVADAVNGGAGTDTLKIFTKTGVAITLPTLTSVENLFVNGTDTNLDVSAATGVTGLQIDAPIGAATFTVSGQTFTLSNDTGNARTFVLASSTDTVENITLSNDVKGAGADTIDIQGAKIATLNITSTGASNTMNFDNTVGKAVTAVKISGANNLTTQFSAQLDGTIKSVDASGATGKISLDLSKAATVAAFTFTGGSAADTLTLAAGEITALTAGTQLVGGGGSDTLTINDAAISAADATKLNATSSFEILGLGTAATVDASQLTATFANHFNVANTGTNSITNMVDASTVDITKSGATATFGPTVGASTLNLNIGSSSSTGLTETLTVTGFSTVNLASNGDTTGTNALGTLVNSDNTKFVVTGANDLTFQLAAGSTTGDKVDASAFTGKLTVTGSSHGDILIGGSGADSIVSGAVASTLTGNGGADSFNVATAVYGAGGQIDTVTDFTKATDKLVLIIKGTDVFTTAAVNVSAATTQAGAINIAVAALGDGSTNGQIDWFQFGGNTYVVESQSVTHATVAATDLVVKLTGAIDLSTLTLTAATATLA